MPFVHSLVSHAKKISISVVAWSVAVTGVVALVPGISKERFSTQTWKVTVSPTSIIAGSHALSAQGEMTALNEALHMEVPNSRRLMGAALPPISPRKATMQ